MAEEFLFRNIFNPQLVDYIGGLLEASGVKTEQFRAKALENLEDLSFGDRASQISRSLELALPEHFPDAAQILVESLGPEPEAEQIEGYDGFYIMPLCMYISRCGLDHPDAALKALYHMTKRFTAEGDIRPFIEKHYEKTMKFLQDLCSDPSPFARRLASEGTRPRLPLSGRLRNFQRDPAPVIDLLNRLYNDPNLMVRRSVANNINDISKDNPDEAIACLKRWLQENPCSQTDWVVRHGLRSLLKAEYPAALSLLGYRGDSLELQHSRISPSRITLGEHLEYEWHIANNAAIPALVLMNYRINFVGAAGRTRVKTFRLREKTISPGTMLVVKGSHHFKDYKNQNFFPGTHKIEFRVNGTAFAEHEFELRT